VRLILTRQLAGCGRRIQRRHAEGREGRRTGLPNEAILIRFRLHFGVQRPPLRWPLGGVFLIENIVPSSSSFPGVIN
jgi:hypothetical protein